VLLPESTRRKTFVLPDVHWLIRHVSTQSRSRQKFLDDISKHIHLPSSVLHGRRKLTWSARREIPALPVVSHL
jgi:hypothetical protein